MKSHRGLASIIGAVFLIAIVIGALSYITYSLEIMGNFSESLITEKSRLKDRQSEAFQITSIDIAAGKLDVVITNTGQIPIKITTLYIDEIGVNDVVNKTTIDKTIFPGSSFGFLSESIDIDIDPTKGYNLKLITSRGETQTFYLNSASQEPLDIQLIASPDRIPTGFSTTLMMVVVNNMSNNNPLVNLTPIDPVCSGICTKLSGPTPVTYDTLNAGDVAIFEWSYALDGDENDSTTFTSGIENGFPGNTDSETVTITNVDFSELAGQSLTSSGFGQTILAVDLLVLHTETLAVPIGAAPPPGPIPYPLRNYELNGDATDEQGGTDLQLSDSGDGLTSTGWNFLEANNAQIVAGEVPDLEYAIEIVFSMVDTIGWGRVLDYHNHGGGYNCGDGTDCGIYVKSNEFVFFDLSVTGGSISDSTLTHVLIQRTASGTFEMYQDGSSIMSFNDNLGQTGNEEAIFRGSGGNEYTSQPAIFFKDDGGEDSDGFVDCIRVWDTAFSSTDANTLTSDSDTCYPFPVSTANSQMSPTISDNSGTTFIFDDTSDSLQWFSANATVGDITIAAGVWNASLRYNSAYVPGGMDSGGDKIWQTFGYLDNANNEGGGHIFHFNDATDTTYDSVTETGCSALTKTLSGGGGGPAWWDNSGVNGTAGFYFGNDDVIQIDYSTTPNTCHNVVDVPYSITGWFKSARWDGNTAINTILEVKDGSGGIELELGDGSGGNTGHFFFRHIPSTGATAECESETNYHGGTGWHHFAAVSSALGSCELYIDGTSVDTDTGGTASLGYTSDLFIAAENANGDNDFQGNLDDIMFWMNHALSAADVTKLHEFSYGENSTRLNVYLSNATGAGVTDEILASDENYGFPWVDQGRYTDVDDLWKGGNWTSSVSEVILGVDSPYSRLNFTLSYASGAPLNLRVDDENIDGTTSTLISSYLQTPPVNPELPIFRVHDNDNKVTFFTFNAGDEGVWFTYQGTRIVFNGTNGHYTGVVNTVNNGVVQSTLNVNTDSPFIDKDVGASIVFWHPQNIPTASQPGDPLKIPPGTYTVIVYIQGYDENGTSLIRSINLGSVLVVE